MSGHVNHWFWKALVSLQIRNETLGYKKHPTGSKTEEQTEYANGSSSLNVRDVSRSTPCWTGLPFCPVHKLFLK